MRALGVTKICGSVISVHETKADGSPYANEWERIREWNDHALALKEYYGDFYEIGFHIHPDFLKESHAEIDKMAKLGVKIMGELVPYINGYTQYATPQMHELVSHATEKGMVVNIHTSSNADDIDAFVEQNPDATIVAAHPGEYPTLMRHLARMQRHEKYYLDLSGTGIFRMGMLRRAIDEGDINRILFGSDFPVCNPCAYVGGVTLDHLLSEEEKSLILSKNAKRLLGLQ
jgi:predicted TIM-barrel fold metal-dependent hydrolase